MNRITLLTCLAAVSIASATAHADEITIGVELGLTGPYAFAGVPAREGIMLALDEVNSQKQAGAHTLKVLVEDTAGEKHQAIALINRFAARDNALIVLGPTSSMEGVAIAPLANTLKIPLLTTTAIADGISKAGPWSFRSPASPALLVDAAVKYATEVDKVKHVALVYARDNEGQISNKTLAEAYFKAHGATVDTESVLTSDTDYQAILTKFMTKPIDALFVSMPSEQSANFIIQARQAGIDDKVRIYGGATMGGGRFLAVGGKAVEGSTFGSDYFVGSTTEENKAFVKAFEAKFKHAPDNYAALGYTAMRLAAQAIKSAGPRPTRESVRDAVAKTKSMPVVLGDGRFSFAEDRNPNYGAIVLKVKNGQFALAK